MASDHPTADPGSFRDPGGRVYLKDGRVFRTVMETAAADFQFVRESGVMDTLAEEGLVLPANVVPGDELGAEADGARYVLEHPRIPFVSYPYEWCFGALKAAALCHLDIQLAAFDKGVILSDASAYNIQFRGARPVFIDYLSFCAYRDGAYWAGYSQYCEQFLNPLLLGAYGGIPHNAWYRGAQEGIPTPEVNQLLPLHRKVSWKVFTHVVLSARLHRAAVAGREGKAAKKAGQKPMPKSAYRFMLASLRKWIAALKLPNTRGGTVWSDYTTTTSYSGDEAARKEAVIKKFVADAKPAQLWDMGCNDGAFAEMALQAGASYVVGFDADQGAVEAAFARAKEKDLSFLPLLLDATNPSPSQGWNQVERKGLGDRRGADALLALALVHHLAIGRNVPIGEIVRWLMEMAPKGIIEFVPKQDAMVQKMLRFRDDIFPSYTPETMLDAMQSHGRIVRQESISESGRQLFVYDRT